MCDACVPYKDLTEDQLNDQIDRISATFVGLPLVVGAPMVMGPEYWLEVARHQVEVGIRICCEPIKDYRPGASIDKDSAAGLWVYRDGVEGVEDPRDRIKRLAREQHEEYLAEVERRRGKRGDSRKR